MHQLVQTYNAKLLQSTEEHYSLKSPRRPEFMGVGENVHADALNIVHYVNEPTGGLGI